MKVEGNVACRLYSIAKQHGYKAIWDAVRLSKAPDFPTFLRGFKKPWTNPHP